MMDDISFCPNDCDNIECFRNKKHIKEPEYPHSYFVETPSDCPKEHEKNVPLALNVKRALSRHLIDSQQTCYRCPYSKSGVNCFNVVLNDAIHVIDSLQNTLEQVRWERDVMADQLHDIRKSFGEKMDDIVSLIGKTEDKKDD